MLNRAGRFMLKLQAGYYLITGLWPVFHRRSFEAVTGPKTDWWLVEMVGLLAAAIGLGIWAASRHAPARLARTLSLAPASAFMIIDLGYALRGTISGVYLLDAAVEGGLAVAALGLVRDDPGRVVGGVYNR
jgi:hypothetical protein